MNSLNKIAFALGSNLANRQQNFDDAIHSLRKAGFQNIQIATPISSSPIDCPQGSEDFLNSAAIAETSLSPIEVLDLFQKIELEVGRLPKEQREINAPRPIDLDILLYNELSLNSQRLTIPHSRMHERDFVLEPLAEIAPDWLIPTKAQSVTQAAQKLKAQQ